MNVLIVGNGPSVNSYGAGVIDFFDGHIIRMNNWRPTINSGRRCDIYSTSAWMDINDRDLTSVYLWLCQPPISRKCYDRLKACADKFGRMPDKIISDEEYADLVIKDNIFKPTTGLTTIKMCLSIYDKIFIAGFDFFKGTKQHYYSLEDIYTTHTPQKEEELIKSFDNVYKFEG